MTCSRPSDSLSPFPAQAPPEQIVPVSHLLHSAATAPTAEPAPQSPASSDTAQSGYKYHLPASWSSWVLGKNRNAESASKICSSLYTTHLRLVGADMRLKNLPGDALPEEIGAQFRPAVLNSSIGSIRPPGWIMAIVGASTLTYAPAEQIQFSRFLQPRGQDCR